MNSNRREWQVGDRTEHVASFSEDDVLAFASLSGDANRIHIDEEYATRSRFGTRIVHGMLVAAQFSKAIAQVLPGEGSVYLEQDLRFLAPVLFDSPVRFEVRVERIIKPGLYELATSAWDGGGTAVVTGRALVLWRHEDRPRREGE